MEKIYTLNVCHERRDHLVDKLKCPPGGSDGKESACNAGDLGSIPGEGKGNPLQYSCRENPLDRGAWWATVYGVSKSWT